MQAEKEMEAYYNGCSLRINEHDDFYINHRSDSMTAELTVSKYHYWDEHEDDNIKRFHFMSGSDGKEHFINFSPYYKPTGAELSAVVQFVEITGRIPDRMDNNNCNFHKDDIFTVLAKVCACGEVDCPEAYAHTTSGY